MLVSRTKFWENNFAQRKSSASQITSISNSLILSTCVSSPFRMTLEMQLLKNLTFTHLINNSILKRTNVTSTIIFGFQNDTVKLA